MLNGMEKHFIEQLVEKYTMKAVIMMTTKMEEAVLSKAIREVRYQMKSEMRIQMRPLIKEAKDQLSQTVIKVIQEGMNEVLSKLDKAENAKTVHKAKAYTS